MSKHLSNDMVGLIAYTLTVDGEVIDTITREDAIEYLHGADNIVPGLEEALEGKTAGDKFEVTVNPLDGYGEYDEDEIEVISMDDFDNPEEVAPGIEIEIMDEDGEVYEALIVSVEGKNVTLDFNHPLAGKDLHYAVEVLEVRDATEKELDLGFPESLLEEMYEDLDDHEHDDVEFSEN